MEAAARHLIRLPARWTSPAPSESRIDGAASLLGLGSTVFVPDRAPSSGSVDSASQYSVNAPVPPPRYLFRRTYRMSSRSCSDTKTCCRYGRSKSIDLLLEDAAPGCFQHQNYEYSALKHGFPFSSRRVRPPKGRGTQVDSEEHSQGQASFIRLTWL